MSLKIDNQITTSKVDFERNSFVHSILHSPLCKLIFANDLFLIIGCFQNSIIGPWINMDDAHPWTKSLSKIKYQLT